MRELGGLNIQHPTSNIERPGEATRSHAGANAEGRMKEWQLQLQTLDGAERPQNWD
jgi:hypothetical protein